MEETSLLRYLKKFEKLVVISLIVMMVFVIFLSTIRVGWILVEEMFRPPLMLLKAEDLMRLFGFFLLVLIGIELLESVKTYLTEDKIHVEVVLSVALVAVARKIITLDLTKYSPLLVLAIAAVVIALSIGYFLLKKAHHASK